MWVNGALWLLVVAVVLGLQNWVGIWELVHFQTTVLDLSLSTYLMLSFLVIWPLNVTIAICMLTQKRSITITSLSWMISKFQILSLRMSCGYCVIIITLGRAVLRASHGSDADASVSVRTVPEVAKHISGSVLYPVIGLLLLFLILLIRYLSIFGVFEGCFSSKINGFMYFITTKNF